MMKTFPCFLLLIQVFFNEAIIQQNKRKQGIVNQTLSKVKFELTDDEANEHRLRKRNRFRRQDSTNIQCRDDSGYDETAQHCCKNCPVGEHVQAACLIAEQDPTCIACDSGTYLGYPSYRDKCIRCLHCDTATQIIMKNCSATSNTQCSCKEGTYQVKGNDGPCHMCTECQNRKVIKHCSKTENTECGQCLPGFYEVKNECRSCLQLLRKQCDNETHEDCAKLCASVTPNPPMYIVIGALLFLLLPIGGLLHHQHKRKKKDTLTASGEHIFTLQDSEKIPNFTERCPESGDLQKSADLIIDIQGGENLSPNYCESSSANISQGQLTSVLQKGSTLYDIIDSVPVRRWKELMRTLELGDKDIEMVEIEFCYYRDQQYEMLRRWCQLRTAALESVYQALEKMNLSGCAEELKRKIEHSQ